MLIESLGYYINSSWIRALWIATADGEDLTTICADCGDSLGFPTYDIAVFDTRELAAAGMRRLAVLLAEPGRALIMQEDIHQTGQGYIGGNWIGRALMACVRNNGGELHLSAEEMTWLPSDGSVQAEHKEDGAVSLAWDATEAGMERQKSHIRNTAIRLSGYIPDDVKITPDPNAPPLKYRLGWKNADPQDPHRYYDAPELDADFDTLQDRWEAARRSAAVQQIKDISIYLVCPDGRLERIGLEDRKDS